MTLEQYIKQAIILLYARNKKKDFDVTTAENVESLYAELSVNDQLCDYIEDIREGHFETGIPFEEDKYYEGKSVAIKSLDGKYIGWTYWFGGGKYGKPQHEPWISEAYFLNCQEKEELVITRKFYK